MEYIDVLDENGIPTGQTATRKEVHEKGLWHRAVLCVIVDNKNRKFNNEVLIRKSIPINGIYL